MNGPQKFAWMLSQERIALLAHELYTLQDVANRLIPGCSHGDQAMRLLNDLRAHTVAAGAEDVYPFQGYGLTFTDTPVPNTWPDPRYLRRSGDREAR